MTFFWFGFFFFLQKQLEPSARAAQNSFTSYMQLHAYFLSLHLNTFYEK